MHSKPARKGKRRRVTPFLVAVALLAACSTSPSSSIAPDGSVRSDDVGRFFTIDEVGLGPDGWVTLHNITDVAASIGSLYLCQPPRCVDLPDFAVAPGSVARIAAGSGAGLADVAMTHADLKLAPSDGEVALFSTNDVSDAHQLWAYIEWGNTPHQGTQTAIDAGLWRSGTYAPSAATAVRLYRTEGGLWIFE